MRKITKVLAAGTAFAAIGGIGLAAMAQTAGPEFGHSMMHGHMGPGMMGMGPGMMGMTQGSATVNEHRDIQDLVFSHDRIKRTVTNLPNGIRTVTESDDPRVAAVLKRHISEMGQRVDSGRDPGLPVESPALHAIFRDHDKVTSVYEATGKGMIVVQTSTDASTVKALQDHAAEVTDLAQRGMAAMHEAMMKNGGGTMGRGMMGGAMMGGAMMGRGMRGETIGQHFR